MTVSRLLDGFERSPTRLSFSADRDTIERIHKQVPGARVLPKPVYRDQLAKALAKVVEPHY